MPLDDMIEREFMARRAPKVVAYGFGEGSVEHPIRTVFPGNGNVDRLLAAGEKLDCDVLYLRMSDGSLVIVRKKT